MLNYVWIILLFLGIGTALTYDIIDKSTDRYRNGVPLTVNIILNQKPGGTEERLKGEIIISGSSISKFYGIRYKEDLSLHAAVFYRKDKESTVHFTIPESAPQVWKDIAGMYGDEDDINARIQFYGSAEDSVLRAGLIPEEVSFLKIKNITNELLSYASTAVQIAIGLIGIMALWLGIMKIAEAAGLISVIARLLKPVTKRLFPDVPSDHPAIGAMVMNISANMLGLGNAATPFGIKAMEELDTLNSDKGTATNSMVTFLAINTAGFTLIPTSAIALRAASGSSDPALIIGTAIFGSLCATIAGISAAKLFEMFQSKRSFRTTGANIKTLLIIIGIIAAAVLLFSTGVFKAITPDAGTLRQIIETISAVAIPFLIVAFLTYGFIKKVKVYEQFIEGAKEGFNIAVRIIPYLVAILVAIGVFRAGGAMDWLVYILSPVTSLIGMPAEALPMALMRPLSGSGSLGIMAEILTVHGPDSFLGILVSTFFGSTETTFYVLAVYFGAVNIKKTRHAVPAGLIADAAGLLGALFIVRLLYG